ncbi:MAG: hypothetical protein ISR69_09550 [Gammaproteobacteria bacterium]|nr:hypothetical protein [Gammaproteobacteria bacterium]
MNKLLAVTFSTLLISTGSYADSREAIVMSEQHRDLLLTEMRDLLTSSQQVLEGVVNEDMAQVEKSARRMGLNAGGGVPKEVGRLLPKGFKSLGPQVHQGFEQIADEADGFGDSNKILKILAKTQQNCVTCHDLYRFEVKK